MHQSSYEKMQLFRTKYLSDKTALALNVLDVGSMDVNGSYRPLFDEPQWNYRGADLEPGKNVDVVLRHPYDFSQISSNSIDVLVSGQALEHMQQFWLFFLEVFRCLKPDGLCCIIAPSSGYEHRYPVDCWRFYPDGMRVGADFARLQTIEIYTDWTPGAHYTDDSAAWRDTVLIARKPHVCALRSLKLAFRSRVLRWLSYR
jgi:SAM-dependent methyltransferase